MKEGMAHPERIERQRKINQLEREIRALDIQAREASSPATYDWISHRIDRKAAESLQLEEQLLADEEREAARAAREDHRVRANRGRLGMGPWMTALLFIVVGIAIGSIATVILGFIVAPLVIAWTKGKTSREKQKEEAIQRML